MKKGDVQQAMQASEQAIQKAEKRKSRTCAAAGGRQPLMVFEQKSLQAGTATVAATPQD